MKACFIDELYIAKSHCLTCNVHVNIKLPHPISNPPMITFLGTNTTYDKGRFAIHKPISKATKSNTIFFNRIAFCNNNNNIYLKSNIQCT